MSDLREGIEAIVADFGDQSRQWGRRNPETWVEQILATITEALTSSDLVEKTTKSLVNQSAEYYAEAGYYKGELPYDAADTTDDDRERWQAETLDVLATALSMLTGDNNE